MEQLNRERAQVEEQLKQAKHEQQRLLNRVDYLEEGERRKRAHRLITKGAAIESILPETKDMDEAGFYNLMEQILLHPDVLAFVDSVLAEKGGNG